MESTEKIDCVNSANTSDCHKSSYIVSMLKFTLVFVALCAIVWGIFALVFLVLAPDLDVGINVVLVVILALVGLFVILVLISMLKATFLENVPNSCKKIKYIFASTQIVSLTLCIILCIFNVVYVFKTIGTTFEERDFSKTNDCSICLIKGANGGRGIFRSGLFKKDEQIYYYCDQCFILIQKEINNNKNSSSTSNPSSGSSNTSFSNKYGTSTTKCYISGCKNYIASSGDTNCCTTHSNRCLNCRCYIDSDAMYCMDCLEDALGK